jgi:hypothetical protein
MDVNGTPVSDVNVTLSRSETGNVTVWHVVKGPDSPISAGVISDVQTYKFEDLPYGNYKVIVDKDGYNWSGEVTVDENYGGRYGSGGIGIVIDYDLYTPVPSYVNLTAGTVYGFARDTHIKKIPSAKVTLWDCERVDGKVVNTGLAGAVKNPVYTNGADAGRHAGFFYFEGVAPGEYNVAVEKDGKTGYNLVTVSRDDVNGTRCWAYLSVSNIVG